jgi:hypothetical protein
MAVKGAIKKRYYWRNPRARRPLRRLWSRLAGWPSRESLNTARPIVIGAIGGSGTRVLRESLMSTGIFMANRTNEAGDALDFSQFLNRNLNAILSETRSVDFSLASLSGALRSHVEAEFLRAVRAHVADAPDEAAGWGFKVARSIYILPLIQEILPGFRFIHLIRDGRDMALSTNQFQFTHHYRALAGDKIESDRLTARLLMWSTVNDQARRFAESHMDGRYWIVRFEDLCAAPKETLADLFDWLGFKADIDNLALKVKAPVSIGRHQDLPDLASSTVAQKISPTLAAFGYV